MPGGRPQPRRRKAERGRRSREKVLRTDWWRKREKFMLLGHFKPNFMWSDFMNFAENGTHAVLWAKKAI